MTGASRPSGVITHGLMAVFLALGVFWTLRAIWAAMPHSGVSWRLLLRALTALGFVLLTARELRAVLAARRSRQRPSSDPQAGRRHVEAVGREFAASGSGRRRTYGAMAGSSPPHPGIARSFGR